MDLVRIGISSHIHSLEKFIEVLKPISENSAPVVSEPLNFPGARLATSVLVISYSIGPSVALPDFPIDQLKTILRPLYELGLSKITYLIHSYNPSHDLAGKSLILPEQLELFQDLCDAEFMDLDRDVSLSIGDWLFPYELYDNYYTEVTEELVGKLEMATSEKECLESIHGRYEYGWLDIDTKRHPSFREMIEQLKQQLEVNEQHTRR